MRALTERECRRLEREGEELSVEVAAEDASGGRRDRKRWPDVVIEVAGGRRAVEIEFAPKGTGRLRGIVRAYASATAYREVLFLVTNAALGRRIRELGKDDAPSTAASPSAPSRGSGCRPRRRTRNALISTGIDSARVRCHAGGRGFDSRRSRPARQDDSS